MKYKILTREVKPFLTLGELVADKHPELRQFLEHKETNNDITDIALRPAELTGKEEYYARIMQEAPKPGWAGDEDV